jgi:putative RNA 2'-phosphotransferase
MAMINEKENTRISKFLSMVLRHKPETIGLSPDKNGWVDATSLIEKMNEHGFNVTAEIIEHIVATNNKKRFMLDETKTMIRASQGHSIEIDLGLQEKEPPEYLYHGTGEKSVGSILANGLERRNRQHVHLSSDIQTATVVGKRHGNPKVFIIAAKTMKAEGFSFYLSDNNVWLVDKVPASYLTLLDK